MRQLLTLTPLCEYSKDRLECEMANAALTDQEAQVLERLKRALANEKEQSKEFISLFEKQKCKIRKGLRETLKAIQRGEAALVLLPQKSPEASRDIVSIVAEVKECQIWSPSVSSEGLGRRLNLKGPCQALAFSKQGDDTDPIASIRNFILQKLVGNPKRVEETTKRIRRI